MVSAEITIRPVAVVSNVRAEPTDDYWGDTISEITLLPHIPTEAFKNIETFSHLEVIYCFDRVEEKEIIYSGHPRGNPAYPEMGIFGQRKKDRPNRIGLCTVELVTHTGRTLKVRFLDAIDGTPVLDIKPVFKEFNLPQQTKQPAWVSDLMQNYWKNAGER